MRYDEKDHPDQIIDRKKFYEVNRGGNQAIEDKAIATYIAEYNAGNIEKAERIFFEIHSRKNENQL